MDGLVKTATEARLAAFAARSQTDPKRYGELVGETIDGKIKGNLGLLGQMINDLGYKTLSATKTLKKAEEDKWEILRQVRDREEKADRLKRSLPWFGLGAVVLALAMTLLLPQVLASNAATCAVLGADWKATTTGVDACVFYNR